MFRYTMIICLALAALSTAAVKDRRSARSIWPFGKSEEQSTDAPILTEEHTRLLEQAGLGKDFNFSSHPLWKIHKYQGIDLKPVHVKTEIVAATTSEPEPPTTTDVDLSFLDDLGGLAYFLPEPKDNDEATDLIADAIEEEEEKEPGFFKKLWGKIVGKSSGLFSSIFGRSENVAEVELKKTKDANDDSLTIFLPETQGSYVAVVVPSNEKPSEELLTSSHVSQFRETSIAPPKLTAEGLVPVNHATRFREVPIVPPATSHPSNTRSQAWIQSWSPHASYNVHIQGEPIDSSSSSNKVEVFERSNVNRTSYERKIGQDEIEDSTEQASPADDEEHEENNAMKDTITDLLSNLNLPEGLWKKLQVTPEVVDAVLNDKEKARALERLKVKQREFDTQVQQLRYSYPRVRKQPQKTTISDESES